MRQSTVLLSTAAVLVLSAGLVVGRLSVHLQAVVPVPATQPATIQPQGGHGGRGWFPDTLGLTPEQQKNMDAVWADVKAQVDKNMEKRKALDHDRDASIKALLTPDQSAKYEQIFADYHAGRAELDKERETFFHAANEKSRALLTPEQQAKWDAMSKDMHDRDHRGGPGGPGGPNGRRNGGGGPATQPVGQPVGASLPSFKGGSITGCSMKTPDSEVLRRAGSCVEKPGSSEYLRTGIVDEEWFIEPPLHGAGPA
jgi:Spy/CpxP family protein refolding chaperone